MIGTYNIGGTNDVKLLSRPHVLQWMSTTQVLCLQESRSLLQDPLRGLLADTHGLPVVSVNCGRQGRAGSGLAIYVASGLLPHTRVLDVDAACGRYAAVRVDVAGHAIAVVNVYVPFALVHAARSDAHHLGPLEALYNEIQELVMTYLEKGMHVVVAGDLNAWVGALEDRQFESGGDPVSGFPARSPDVSHPSDVSGGLLVDMCVSTSLLLCTGRFGDSPVQASYVRAGACTRVDHILVSAGLFPVVASHTVRSDLQLADDHLPLAVSMILPCLHPPSAPPAAALERVVWDPSKAAAYANALEVDAIAASGLQECLGAIAAGEAALAVTRLHDAMKRAALVAGMRVAACSSPHSAPTRRRFPAWFDLECRRAYAAAAAAAPPQGAPPSRGLLRALLRRKKLQHAQAVLWPRWVAMAGCPAAFWRQLRHVRAPPRPGLGCPDVHEFTEHFAGVFGGPGVPDDIVDIQQQPASSVVDDLFSSDAVVGALRGVRSSAAPGLAGIPAQAFTYDPVLHCVTPLLRLVFTLGREPGPMQEGVLTPLFKQGPRYVTGNYRPIVVNSVLHKIYANVIRQELHSHISADPDVFRRQAGFQ